MKKDQIIANALVQWLSMHINQKLDFAIINLPKMDVQTFFKAISEIEGFQQEEYSIALAGYDLNSTELRLCANAAGLDRIFDLADDFNSAGGWRNNRSKHKRIIALSVGRQPGVHTLRHFYTPSSKELAKACLSWALGRAEYTNISVQKKLLSVLENSSELENIITLEAIADYLVAWAINSENNPNDAPRKALPYLGLLYDPQLFADPGNIESKLISNLDMRNLIMDASPSLIHNKRRSILKINSIELRDELLIILKYIDNIRLSPVALNLLKLTLEDAEKIFKQRVQTEAEDDSSTISTSDEDFDDNSEQYKLKNLVMDSANAILDKDEVRLKAIVEALERSWVDGDQQNESTVEGEINFQEGGKSFSFELDVWFLSWLHSFCNVDCWGGMIHSKEPSLELSIKNLNKATKEPIYMIPSQLINIDGTVWSMNELLAKFDRVYFDQHGTELNLLNTWKSFVLLREKLIEHLDYIVYVPLTWIAGKPELFQVIESYIEVSSNLYSIIHDNYYEMNNLGEKLAGTVLEGLLSLDIFQVQLELNDGNYTNKAILLPTHPLHIWRFQRMVGIIYGLGSHITVADREAILQEMERPEYYLSVLWLGTMPEGKGLNQELPVSNMFKGLAIFENLKNSISSTDGIKELLKILYYFTGLSRHHTRPLRLTLVNPPEPSKLLSQLTGIFSKRRENTLPSLSVEMIFTFEHHYRRILAQRLSGERELIEDFIASGRLQLYINDRLFETEDLVDYLKERPSHIVAIFDVASVNIRRSIIDRALPMSPFCVRRTIKSDLMEDKIYLKPTSDMPPFSEYMQLVNEAQRGQRDSSPFAWADAENMRTLVDSLLKYPKSAAHWLFLADRALPDEGKMNSVRLVRKNEGQRQIFVAANNYSQIASKVRKVFDNNNLALSMPELEKLLQEGSSLLGEGCLDILNADGTPNQSRVIGLAGMLIAARDYRQRYPDTLLVSVDSYIARLWLRLRVNTQERCDLLSLRVENNASIIIECIEVKTTLSSEISNSEILYHALGQLKLTLKACEEAIPDNYEGNEPLSAPRCEMLKEIFVTACQNGNFSPDKRRKWGQWLKDLFKEADSPLPVKYQGEVIEVLIGNNEVPSQVEHEIEPYLIRGRKITEHKIQELLVGVNTTESEFVANEIANGRNTRSDLSRDQESSHEASQVKETDGSNIVTQRTETTQIQERQSKEIYSDLNHNTEHDLTMYSDVWPPELNALGLIGQNHAVAQIINQVNYSHASGSRFSDKLLVGPAGVGKSSLARAIAERLLDQKEILINGADLTNPKNIVNILKDQGKLPNRSRGVIEVRDCLIFIDEVHGIRPSVANTLLGALDDTRITTIDSVNYDFNKVIFILATTDPGSLSEAFTSRPDKIYLSSYTLEELSAIVWLHGKKHLNNVELTREVCIEIAARTRCQPRRAVRTLTQTIIPYFYSLTHEIGEMIDYTRLSNAINSNSVAKWFNEQGIDLNGIDSIARNFLSYLKRGATSGSNIQQALGITNKGDFVEITEYLIRLGLINITSAGCTLTNTGRSYLVNPVNLRDKISRRQVL